MKLQTKQRFKMLTPYLQISTIKARNAIMVEEAIKIASGE